MWILSLNLKDIFDALLFVFRNPDDAKSVAQLVGLIICGVLFIVIVFGLLHSFKNTLDAGIRNYTNPTNKTKEKPSPPSNYSKGDEYRLIAVLLGIILFFLLWLLVIQSMK